MKIILFICLIATMAIPFNLTNDFENRSWQSLRIVLEFFTEVE